MVGNGLEPKTSPARGVWAVSWLQSSCLVDCVLRWCSCWGHYSHFRVTPLHVPITPSPNPSAAGLSPSFFLMLLPTKTVITTAPEQMFCTEAGIYQRTQNPRRRLHRCDSQRQTAVFRSMMKWITSFTVTSALTSLWKVFQRSCAIWQYRLIEDRRNIRIWISTIIEEKRQRTWGQKWFQWRSVPQTGGMSPTKDQSMTGWKYHPNCIRWAHVR